MTDDLSQSPRSARTKDPVLITTATRWEARPLAEALSLPESGEERWEGLACGRRIVLLKTGMGALKTRERLERDCVAADHGLVLSTGLCGAMQPGVKTGDIVADAQDADIDRVTALKETAAALGLPFHFGRILHTNIVLEPSMKRKLGAENRALACDMETAAVRRWAQDRVAVIGLRVVLDSIDERVPSDAPETEDPAGLARYALTHADELPLLVRTGLRSARGMKRLAGFVRAYLEAI